VLEISDIIRIFVRNQKFCWKSEFSEIRISIRNQNRIRIFKNQNFFTDQNFLSEIRILIRTIK